MKILHRLRALFRKEELDQQLSDELAFHFEKQIEQNVAAARNLSFTPAELQRIEEIIAPAGG